MPFLGSEQPPPYMYALTGAPSVPNIIFNTSTSSSITLSWTHPLEESIFLFIFRYTFSVIGCPDLQESAIQEPPPVTADSVRTRPGSGTFRYSLQGLEENSQVTVRITAFASTGTSPDAVITLDTQEAGKYVYNIM